MDNMLFTGKIRSLRILLGLAMIAVLAAGCVPASQPNVGSTSSTPTVQAAVPLTGATQSLAPTSSPVATQAPSLAAGAATQTSTQAPALAATQSATQASSATAVAPTALSQPTAMPSATMPPMVMTVPVTPPSNTPSVSVPQTGPQQVSIANLAFNPASLTVVAGTTVTWKNNDNTTHTVTANNGAFNSGALNPGATFSFTFNQPGTFDYHCMIHPFMTGSITVVSSASGSAASPNVSAPRKTQPPAGFFLDGIATVAIQNSIFMPQTFVVPLGTKVQWFNDDNTVHTVTADSGTFDSGPLQPGGRFAVAFTQAGTYSYHDNKNPNNVGTIIVVGSNSASQAGGGVPGMNGGSASPSQGVPSTGGSNPNPNPNPSGGGSPMGGYGY